MKGCVGRGVMLGEMEDATHDGADGACIQLAITAVGKFFALDTILLVSEGKRGKGCGGAMGGGGSRCVEEVATADLVFDICEAKGGLCHPGGIGVFPRAEEEVKGDPDAVQDCGVAGGGGIGEGGACEEDGHGDRFDTCWWGIDLLPSGVHAAEAEILFAGGIEAWIRGPQAG